MPSPVDGPRSERRIQQITEAAACLFADKGYEETSVQDVAEAIGVLKGSLYYYMNTKEDLLFWVLRRNHDKLWAHVVEEQPYVGIGPVERVGVFVARHVGFVLDNAAISALYAQRFPTLAATPQRREEILERRRAIEHKLVDLVAAAHSSGDRLDAILTSRALLSMCNAAHSWFHPGGRFTKDQIVGHHADLAIRALIPREQTQ